ncbi:MAG: aminotransferase class III-fold pyridoxal phosphate-dependent enzyme [Candidatus Dormibacterales bacterium]
MVRGRLPGPRAAALIERDRAVLSPSFTRGCPFVMDRGEGCWVTDVDGNVFLDFTAGIAVAATGHSHPRVVAAVREQAGRFLHMSGTDFYYGVEVELAERLTAALMPGGRVFFTNSGTEAVEGAMKLARHATGRPNFLAFLGGFHGRTLGALSLTASRSVQRRGFAPFLPSVFHADYPSAARGVSTDRSLESLERLLSTVAPPESVAAVFVEPIQGEGGYLVPPPDFLPRLREVTRRHGILLAVDEVQTGMGRTGSMCAFQHAGVDPDIVCLAKGVASGLPLGAFLARAPLMVWPPGAHGTTFGGNPVACAAALATLDLLQEGLVENAADVGGRLRAGLDELAAAHPGLVADVRGQGLMLALELDPPDLAAALVEAAFRRGLLLLTAGVGAVRLAPPLVLEREEAELGVEIIGESLVELEAGP